MSVEGNEASYDVHNDSRIECRACLIKLEKESNMFNLFEAWPPPSVGMESTIADDLTKLANIQILETDRHSKVICEECCKILQNACKFVANVRKNDLILRQRFPQKPIELDVSSETVWPKPIQLDKNIDGSVYEKALDVEIKQEVLSEDEYNTNSNGMDEGYRDAALDNFDIKIEPEELIEQKPIQINGTISLNQLNAENSMLPNGDETYENEEFLEPPVKEEPPSEEEEEEEEDPDSVSSDLPLDCLLCAKVFKSVSGLKSTIMKPPKKRGLWSLKQLQAAMAAVQGGSLSQREASARYSIPRKTLHNHLKSGKVEKRVGRRTILTTEQENDLASRVKRLAAIGFPLTPKIILNHAYVFCEQHNIKNNFSQSIKRPGKDWLKLFLKRHPDILKRKVEILNPGRAQKINKPIAMHHFTEYRKIYEELDIGNHPQRLYNMDEKGCRLTIHNQPVVLAQKGAKRVHMDAPEHAENVTVAVCVNASGSSIPPMIIFKGERLKPEFKDNLPAGTIVKIAPKGSMTSSLFIDFIHHLGQYKTTGKCLLVFDGTSCHLDDTIVDAADKEDIVLYSLPSNSTHKLQPLDKSVNKSFEHYWDEETSYQHADKKLAKTPFNSIFSRVWSKCMTYENIINGFRATGLYPYNSDAISAEACAPSVLTERPGPPERESVTCNDRSSKKSPTPDSYAINLRRAVQCPNSSDSEQRNDILSVSTNAGIKRRLVEYSSSDLVSAKSILATEPSTSGAAVRRPIIYSSNCESDTSSTKDFIPWQKIQPQFINDVYSSEDENADPLLRQEHTPIKEINVSCVNTDVIRQHSDSSTTSYDSEDNMPLGRLKAKQT